MKYEVKLIYPNWNISFLVHKNRFCWCKKTATKHAKEFVAKNPEVTYVLIED